MTKENWVSVPLTSSSKEFSLSCIMSLELNFAHTLDHDLSSLSTLLNRSQFEAITVCACSPTSTSQPAIPPTLAATWPRPQPRSGHGPKVSGYGINIRGLFLGQSTKQMKAKMDEIVSFTKLAYYLAMPLRTYPHRLAQRLARGVVTSIELEILLLSEGIGAVDSPFMAKAYVRLQELVKQLGTLVLTSYSNGFLAQLCNTPCGSPTAPPASAPRWLTWSSPMRSLAPSNTSATCWFARSWRPPTPPSAASSPVTSDASFIRAAVNGLASRYSENEVKVFAVDLSNGGGMAIALSCHAPDLVAGVVGVAGAYYNPTTNN